MQYAMTALIYAAQNGHLEVAAFLIQHGAQVQHQDKVMRRGLRECDCVGARLFCGLASSILMVRG